MKIWADFHTHTRYSHGRGWIEDNVRAAAQKGLKVLAITDHGPGVLWIGVPFARKISHLREELSRCAALYPQIELLLGVEANIIGIDGTLDITSAVVRELDFLIVGLHPWVFSRGFRSGLYLSFFNTLARLKVLPPDISKGVNTQALINAIRRYPVDVISHPGLFFTLDMPVLTGVCRERGTLLELNNNHVLQYGKQLKEAAENGALFALNSDAHHPSAVGEMDDAVRAARLLGIEEERIFNVGTYDGAKEAWIKGCQSRRGDLRRVLPGELMYPINTDKGGQKEGE